VVGRGEELGEEGVEVLEAHGPRRACVIARHDGPGQLIELHPRQAAQIHICKTPRHMDQEERQWTSNESIDIDLWVGMSLIRVSAKLQPI
jgi:hypothetical protein